MGIFETILAFMEKGGDVLWLIAILVLFMWTLIFERAWYFASVWKQDRAEVLANWEGRGERKSWNAKKIRQRLLSESRELINDNMNGGGDAKSMAGGVERSTIPTMAGTVAALSGLFANTYLQRITNREQQLLTDQLTSDH